MFQIIHNLDLKVIEQRKILDLLKYEKKSKKTKLTDLEKEYEHLLIESTKSELVKSKTSTRAKKVFKMVEGSMAWLRLLPSGQCDHIDGMAYNNCVVNVDDVLMLSDCIFINAISQRSRYSFL